MATLRFSILGMNRPLQWGQSSPHPSPDLVARTRPPTAMSPNVAEAVATESFWKRVTGPLAPGVPAVRRAGMIAERQSVGPPGADTMRRWNRLRRRRSEGRG